MSDDRRDPESQIPLTPAVLHILMALVPGELHGYGIMKEVETTTDGKVRMGPGTLYGTIKRMLDAGLIEEADEREDPVRADGERRRCYRMTGFGERVYEAEVRWLEELIRIAGAKQRRLQPA